MTHNELLEILDSCIKGSEYGPYEWGFIALRAVVELHNPNGYHNANVCDVCDAIYPCQTIKAIENELNL